MRNREPPALDTTLEPAKIRYMAKRVLDKQVATRIDGETAKRLAEIAKREDRSESAILRRALRFYVETDRAATEAMSS